MNRKINVLPPKISLSQKPKTLKRNLILNKKRQQITNLNAIVMIKMKSQTMMLLKMNQKMNLFHPNKLIRQKSKMQKRKINL